MVGFSQLESLSTRQPGALTKLQLFYISKVSSSICMVTGRGSA